MRRERGYYIVCLAVWIATGDPFSEGATDSQIEEAREMLREIGILEWTEEKEELVKTA